MMKLKSFIFVACMAMVSVASAHIDYNAEPAERYVASPDTIYEDESFRFKRDSIAKTRIPENKTNGKDIDAMKHLLERRYLADGETFTKRWDDHLFVEAGCGFEQMVPPGQGYKFNALTVAHLGLGKQFNKLHSARVLFNGAFGYQQDLDKIYYKVGVTADHLFSLTSYINGFKPSRLLDVSTVLGVGAQYAKYGRKGRTGTSYDVHMGLQFRFFTGPQGYINIEPYYGIATDKRDLSENRNWRKMDMFYGANLNFIYYLRNNLSPEARRRFIKERTEDNELVADSTALDSWRQPWFFEFSNGVDFVDSHTLGLAETMGHNFSISVGKWLSSAIGIRFTGTSSTATWLKDVTPEKLSPYQPPYERDFRSYYVGLRGEALFNPLGFSANYNWDSPLGFYLFAGGEMGRIMKFQPGTELRCNTQAYTFGAHLWARLTDGLQVFVEPRYANYVYKVPYSNVAWNERFSDDTYSLNVGLTVSTTGMKYRRANAADDGEMRHVVVGLGGGTNITQTRNGYKGSAGMPFNGIAFGEYHFNRIHSARVAFDFVSLSRAGISSYTDYRMDIPEEGYAPVQRSGLWNHRYYFGFVSLNYMVNLTNLCSGYRPGRRFELEAYVGPTCDMLFGETATLSENERLQEGHECRLNKEAETVTKFGFNAGLKLNAHITPRIDVFFSPTIYALRNFGINGVNFTKLRHIETFNIGAQYKF